MKTLITAIAIILSVNAYSQKYIVQVKSKETKRWGYVNLKGEYIIRPKHEKCYHFSEDGYAPFFISDDEGYRYVSSQGKVLNIQLKSFEISMTNKNFKNGYLPVYYNNKWGYIDTTGKVVIPSKYKEVTSFDNGYALVKLKKNYYIIDKKGNEILLNIPQIKDVKLFSEGLAIYINKKGQYGFFNVKGEIIIPAQFKGAGYFSSGFAWARTSEGLIGFINKKGEWHIEPKFSTVYNFDSESGMARVKYNYQWGYVNKKGEIFIKENLLRIGDYSEGIAKAKLNGKYGFLGQNQEWIIQPQFESTRNFKNGYVAVKMHGKWGLIDKKGEWVLKPGYLNVKDVILIN